MLILVTGGAASGKSAYAERLAVRISMDTDTVADAKRVYLATMLNNDTVDASRIHAHRMRRKEMDFETVELPRDILKMKVEGEQIVLLECLSNLLANEMFGGTKLPQEKILSDIRALYRRKETRHLLIVTNEVFSDGIRYDDTTEAYIHTLGELNRTLALAADAVVEVVYGIPVVVKCGDDGLNFLLREQGVETK